MTIYAVYRSEADILELGIGDAEPVAVVHAQWAPRCVVGHNHDGWPVSVDLAQPGRGLDALDVVAPRDGHDRERLLAAARAALDTPDGPVRVDDRGA